MDATLKERIDLLHDTNQINDDIFHELPGIFEKVEKFLDVKLTEENAGSFASHISVALQRISEKKAVTEIAAELETVIEKNPDFYEFAKKLLSESSGDVDINAEAAFITLYFCLLTGRENE
ncbi:PRD domain-containing protein [Bacillus canaveralius]|uniref:PRD domain-containing protein n=1 Tax=Bacillus canaveralius TaxID=1403243 RepID=A0A2N5GM66_9BACI|nr:MULTISPECIES: PRD domain-containing protein [Bacillus]PLR80602.1 PRD domain-containing protein [Bacillus sp. V33-4]PLR82957.1 PRD domain-containing protein [Bacillus canaveralius]PLR97038.1 PRD domain-containing protein [Bacillus canaveralius]RSK47886.1 PRD domain-containing protein [Bacillus canaveralius]